jgi:predicted Fe-Mo cluster-binding NifX family protein
MKIAIVSEKESLDARIDSRFGRCAYFAIYDTDSKTSTTASGEENMRNTHNRR